MFKEISIEQYLSNGNKTPVIDVRSPKEFLHAHIPAAHNIPLFTDEERAQVGIIYKKEGNEKAVLKGLELVSPKIINFIMQAKELSVGNSIQIHCWRGGMRSKSMATLFDFAGIKTEVITGGYKSYRRAAKNYLSQNYNLIILGGKTGSGKTKILHALKNAGEQIIDLEKLANHKGSAFGNLGEQQQPSTELFENLLFEELRNLNRQKRIWVENESQLIGTVFIPEEFWKQMQQLPVINLQFPLHERINFLVNDYGNFNPEELIKSLNKIRKKLGGQHFNAAVQNYETGNLYEAAKIILVYYDKAYNFGLTRRIPEKIFNLELNRIDPEKNANEILKAVAKNKAIGNMRNHTVKPASMMRFLF